MPISTPVRVHQVDTPEAGFLTRVIVDVPLPDGRVGSLVMADATFRHIFGEAPAVDARYILTTGREP